MVSWLQAALERGEAFAFGELRIEPGEGGWTIGVPACGGTPADLVEATEPGLRALIQADAVGRYRPITGARSLRSGWRTPPLAAPDLYNALETVYPLSTRHIEMEANGELQIVPLDIVLARQSGRYEAASKLSRRGRELTTEIVCGQCVRVPCWAGQDSRDAIPCPEPCSIVVSFCREAMLWEASPPVPASPDPSVAFAAFDEPGNERREAWLARRFAPEPPADAKEEGDGVSQDSRD